MAKSPSKPAAKKATKSAAAPNLETTAPVKPVKRPSAKMAPAKQPAAKVPAQPSKVGTSKAKAPPSGKASSKSVLKQTSEKISQLASDILADRIVPTVEQIKAIAASALGQDESKSKKSKGKKK